MIENYVHKLIENLPNDNIQKLERLDLVLDGGIFNGSYLVGALYFLREMEKRSYIKIERISGCSIGSLVAFLYLIDSIELMPELYGVVKAEFETNCTINMSHILKTHLKHRIPNDVCDRVNKRLFICYNNVKKNKKIVKSNYKNIDDILDTIIRSCYVPFLIDNHLFYKRKYVDGMNPFLFPPVPNKKILFMNLLSYDKLFHTLNIKNEKNNFHRVLTGLLDIHSFYIKQTNTSMCSFVNDWNIIDRFYYNLRGIIERILIYILIGINYCKKYFSKYLQNNIIIQILSRLIFDIFSIFLHTYCF